MSTKSTNSLPIGTVVANAGPKGFLPDGWLVCDGSPIPLQYEELIELLGGNKTPDFAGKTLIGTGTAKKTKTTYELHQTGGEEQVTLTIDQMPAHTHNYENVNNDFTMWGSIPNRHVEGYDGGGNDLSHMGDLPHTGGSQPHSNMQPWTAINYIIFAGSAN